MAQVFAKEDDIITNDYDIKECRVDPDDDNYAKIINKDDGVDLNGGFAVLSYTV